MRSASFKTVAFLSLVFLAAPAFAGPWNDHTKILAQLSRKIETKEEEVRHLLHEKGTVHDEKKIAHIIRELAAVHKELERVSKQYEEERQHVRFEHPERSATLKRTYVRHQVHSVDEMDKGVGIDSSLDRAKIRVLSTFQVPDQEAPEPRAKVHGPRKPASAGDEDALEQIHFSK